MIEECDLCRKNSAQYRVTSICCALRLIESTPQHGARQAMWAHLASTLPDESFSAIRQAAEERGLIPRRRLESAAT